MTGDVLLSNMLFRYREFPLGCKMPDSPDSLIKNQINSNSTNGLQSVNGSHSPHPPSDTPSPPVTSSSALPHHLEMQGGNSARGKQVITVKRFLATLQQFASDMSTEIGERVHSLILGLVSSSVSIEEFRLKIQESTNYPLRPFAVPFLKSHLPLLQAELLHFSRLAKLTPQQYLRQHEHLVLDAAPSQSQGAEPPFELHPAVDASCSVKRRSPPSRNGKPDSDYADSNGDGPPPTKRHHPLPSPTLVNHRTSPVMPPGLSVRLPDNDHGYRTERYDRFDRDFYRPFYGNAQVRDYSDDRDMDEEWKNIHTMLNCILGMVEKTKRALCILQHRSFADLRPDLPGWVRHELEPQPKAKRTPPVNGGDLVSHLKIAEDRVSEVRRRAEEAVHEVKRQAVAELQKAVSAAEAKAGELVAAERLRMERLLAEARRQAAEDALAQATQQEESTENCWNCGRKANETCSGCNIARYCGSFCQHKDWESHHRVCGQSSSSSNHPNATSSTTTPPRTTTDHSPSPSRTNLVDIKPIKIDTM